MMISTGPRREALDSPTVVFTPLSFPYAIDNGRGNIIEDLDSPHFPYPHGERTVCPPPTCPLKILLAPCFSPA